MADAPLSSVHSNPIAMDTTQQQVPALWKGFTTTGDQVATHIPNDHRRVLPCVCCGKMCRKTLGKSHVMGKNHGFL